MQKKQTKRIISGTILLVIVLTALFPAGAFAQEAPKTWQSILEDYPGHEIQKLEMTLEQTRGLLRWSDIVAQQGADVHVKVFSASGIQINVATNDIQPATGQHAAIILAADSRGANLYDVLIMGDVLGTGLLNISQVARMAAAITGVNPLEGIYLEAGDINGTGTVDIGDLTTLARWLRG